MQREGSRAWRQPGHPLEFPVMMGVPTACQTMRAPVGTDERKDRFMHKGLGIAALIIAVIGMGVPVITIYIV